MCIRLLSVVLVLALAPATAQERETEEMLAQQLRELEHIGPQEETDVGEDDHSLVHDPGISLAAGDEPAAGITNADITEMADGGFSDTMIVAVIRANTPRFDISPRALVALKNVGVSETVMEAMLAAEAENRRAAETAPAAPAAQEADDEQPPAALGPELLASLSPEELLALQEVLEQHAPTRVPVPATVPPAPEERPAGADGPRAWIVDRESRRPMEATTAQVAFTEARGGGAALNTLQSFAGNALAFVQPALGIAGNVGGLFRSGDPTGTLVWALRGPYSARILSGETMLEVEFAGIPGVNPDQYQPAIVQLVPTIDNYRLVGAARTRASSVGGIPTGNIIEEQAAAEITRLARGRYRVSLDAGLSQGEYALVLRPIVTRERRRNADGGSLGELMGTQAGEILYTTWDFSMR